MKTFWHWVDYLTQQCEVQGKTPCYINLDETSVPRCTAKVSGFVAPKRLWPGLAPPRRRIQKQQKRAAVTQVVLITDLVDIQPILPQIFLCNERVVPASALASADFQKPETVHFWRGKSGWNNVRNMLRILVQLRKVFVDRPHLQPILLLDCVGCHIHPEVVAKARDLELWMAVVPAGLTFLLQPLDVYAFAPYKTCLAKCLLEAEAELGNLDVLPWMECLCSTFRKFWCSRKWKAAFQWTGVLQGGDLTQDLQHLAVARLPFPLLPPDFESVQATFPRRSHVPYASLFWRPARLDPPVLT